MGLTRRPGRGTMDRTDVRLCGRPRMRSDVRCEGGGSVAKTRVQFVCSECGGVQAKWLGKCPDCGEWNTLEEVVVRPAEKPRRVERTRAAKRCAAGGVDRDLGGRLAAADVGESRVEPGAGRRDRAGRGRAGGRRPRHRQKHAAVADGGGGGRDDRAGPLCQRRGERASDSVAAPDAWGWRRNGSLCWPRSWSSRSSRRSSR